MITGSVDVGQLAHLDAAERGDPGEHHQRVEHEGEDRPAHEERDAPAAAGGEGRSGSGSELRTPSRRVLGQDRRVALERRPGRPGAGAGRPSVITRSPAASSPATSTRVAVALHHAHRHARRRAVAGDPDEGALGAPLDRERIDRRETPRRGTRARSRRPCRRAARSSALSSAACTRRVRLALSTRLSSAHDLAARAAARAGPARWRSPRSPIASRPAKRSGTRKSTRMRERSSMVASSVAVETWVPGSTGRMPTMPPIGATMVRRSSASAASRTSSSAVRAASRASRSATSVAAPRACSCSIALERRLRLGHGELGAGQRDRLGLVVEPRDHVARRHPRAGGDLEREQPPGDQRRHRDRVDGAAVADRRDPPRRLRGHHLGADHRDRSPRRVVGLPAGRRWGGTLGRRQAEAGQQRRRPAGGTPPTPRRRRHQRERHERLLPPAQSAPQLIRCPILSSERGRGVRSVAPGVRMGITLS